MDTWNEPRAVRYCPDFAHVKSASRKPMIDSDANKSWKIVRFKTRIARATGYYEDSQHRTGRSGTTKYRVMLRSEDQSSSGGASPVSLSYRATTLLLFMVTHLPRLFFIMKQQINQTHCFLKSSNIRFDYNPAMMQVCQHGATSMIAKAAASWHNDMLRLAPVMMWCFRIFMILNIGIFNISRVWQTLIPAAISSWMKWFHVGNRRRFFQERKPWFND